MSPAFAHDDTQGTSDLCHDGDLQTSCAALPIQDPFLELVFPVTYVHKVLLVNRYCDDRNEATRRKIRERINGAKVDLINGEDQIKSCGTVSTDTEKETFWLDCGATGTTIRISMQRIDYLNLGEVVIYTLGNFQKFTIAKYLNFAQLLNCSGLISI